jgi:hypothetical protein
VHESPPQAERHARLAGVDVFGIGEARGTRVEIENEAAETPVCAVQLDVDAY